jgi:hypothetical protein
MATVSQRAERLDVIRDLVVLGVQKQIRRRSHLQRIAIGEKILVRSSDRKPLDYTSVYRYFDVLRFLGFDESEEYGIEDNIIWSSSAIELAQCGRTTYRTNKLSDPEKVIFRRRIFLSNVVEQFLSLFCHTETTPQSQTQFMIEGRPLYIVNVSVKRPPGVTKDDTEWPAEDNVEISLDPESGVITRRPTKEFLYTYRYWCLDSGIVDELNVREAERCGVPKSRSYALFPLDPMVDVTPAQFLDMIYSTLGGSIRQPQAIPIPWLMYQICPKAKISVEEFKSLLLKAWIENRRLLHLERGPGGLIKGKIYSPEHNHSERYGNQRYYPIVDGTVRSNLAVFPKT